MLRAILKIINNNIVVNQKKKKNIVVPQIHNNVIYLKLQINYQKLRKITTIHYGENGLNSSSFLLLGQSYLKERKKK